MKIMSIWWSSNSCYQVLPKMLLFLTIFGVTVSGVTSKSFTVYENRDVEKFHHLCIHRYSGNVYIGATNRIVQLTHDLKHRESVEMGPREDSPFCPVTRVCPDEQKTMTNYYNKVLAIDYSRSELIACGSLFQGVCTVHDVENVTIYETPANESVAANEKTASTVAFIAQGPKDLSRKHVLYVGVSYTRSGPYRSDVPAVSSRSLDPLDMFSISSTGVTTGTQIMLNSLSRDIYPIKYIFGFSSNGFSYFVTVQGKYVTPPKPFSSKLIRICQNDLHYYSYTEVPLVCKTEDGTDYNLAQAAYIGHPGSELSASLGVTAQDDVLFVVFAKSGNEEDEPSANSALCIYALSAIQSKFTQNIKECFNGNGQRGLDFINRSYPCQATQVQIMDDFCGLDVNSPLEGVLPIQASPVLQLSGVLLTSIIATASHKFTAAFLGTSTGHLKKVSFESSSKAIEYGDIVIDEGSPVNPDMAFNKNKTHIYVMTDNKVTMVKLHECNSYKTCDECLDVKNPFCGWCSIDNKCTLQSECVHSVWISYKNKSCILIKDVFPLSVPIKYIHMMTISVDNFPQSDEELLCVFNILGKTLITDAVERNQQISCQTPDPKLLPPISSDEHEMTGTLAIRKLGFDLVAINVIFYDCTTYNLCSVCVSGPFSCSWCTESSSCMYEFFENCHRSEVYSIRSGMGSKIGPNFCPRFKIINDDSPLLIPSGTNRNIEYEIENFQFSKGIFRPSCGCVFNIEGKRHTVQAFPDAEEKKLRCESMEFSYDSLSPNVTALLGVYCGFAKLENQENSHAIIYKCERMANTCGLCLGLPSKYQCSWCLDDSGSCRNNDKCGDESVWLDQDQICPDPVITMFTPTSGPLEGGTNITIIGIDLGRSFEDIKEGVKIVDEGGKKIVDCKPFEELYEKTTKIVCQVERTNSVNSGYVSVTVRNKFTVVTTNSYSIVHPLILNISPDVGPKSGGTHLQIWGRHLDAGSHAKAYVAGLPCTIISRELSHIECITSSAVDLTRNEVKVIFDNAVLVSKRRFSYVNDPIIESINTYENSDEKGGTPRGISSGGVTITIRGLRLNVVVLPQIYVLYNGTEYTGNCKIESEKLMKCKSPAIPHPFGDNEKVLPLDYGFKMDDVEEVKRMNDHPKFSKFMLHPDPVYYPFNEEDNIKYFRSDYLTIHGKNLDLAFREYHSDQDVMVKVGTGFCEVVSLSFSQLTCKQPTEQPAAEDAFGSPEYNRMPKVIVEVGDKMRFIIGFIIYEYSSGPE